MPIARHTNGASRAPNSNFVQGGVVVRETGRRIRISDLELMDAYALMKFELACRNAEETTGFGRHDGFKGWCRAFDCNTAGEQYGQEEKRQESHR